MKKKSSFEMYFNINKQSFAWFIAGLFWGIGIGVVISLIISIKSDNELNDIQSSKSDSVITSIKKENDSLRITRIEFDGAVKMLNELKKQKQIKDLKKN